MSLQNDLQRIVDLARAAGVECPGCGGTGHGLYGESEGSCSVCHGTQRVPDQAVKGLVEMLLSADLRCECGCEEYVLRGWHELPPGALTGALKQWTAEQAEKARLANDGNVYYPLRDLSDAIGRLFGLPDCDPRAVHIMLEFLEAKEAK